MIPLAVRTCGNCGTHFKGDDAKCPKCNPTSTSIVVKRRAVIEGRA